jgi:hypothetical protein
VIVILVLAMVQVVGADSIANHVVISEVQIKGDDNTKHDSVEIYNPTDTPIDLHDYNLRKMTSSGTESSIKSPIASSGTYIQPYGFYLWASLADSLLLSGPMYLLVVEFNIER